METTSKIPFRRKLADHLEKMYNKYKYYECMPENDEGYETIDPDGYLNIADSIIPMVKGEYKSKQTTSQQQTIERLREVNEKLKKALNIIIGFEEYQGRKGCTYGDTDFDSMSAAKGFNDCLDYVKSIAASRLQEAEQLLNTTEQPERK